MMWRILTLCLVFLAACGPRGEITYDPSAKGVGASRTIFVGTTRAIDTETGVFGRERQRGDPQFARFAVSVPPGREPGEITWPRRGRPVDPQRDFVTTSAHVYPGAPAFRAELSRELAAEPSHQRDVVVFVHGFNNTFAEGLYRIAQLDNDMDLPAAVVHYSWPSSANLLDYVGDGDSAVFARDGLERLLDEVAAAGADNITLIAHSMGAYLAMETLRQMSIRGTTRAFPRIGGVVLISPDIDVDVFHSQASAIPKLPQPFIIFTSRRDRALALSSRLTGQRDRLGNLTDLAQVDDLQVTVVDVAAFNVGLGHFNVGDSPALIKILTQVADARQAYDSDAAVRTGLLPGVVLTVQQATKVILSPVAAIAAAN